MVARITPTPTAHNLGTADGLATDYLWGLAVCVIDNTGSMYSDACKVALDCFSDLFAELFEEIGRASIEGLGIGIVCEPADTARTYTFSSEYPSRHVSAQNYISRFW